MTSKEALDFLNHLISREKHMDSERNKKINDCYNLIKKDLERLENLEKQNKLLKKELKKYQAYIKKGVEEHYEDFMSDYDLLLQECQGLNKKLEVLEILKRKSVDISLIKDIMIDKIEFDYYPYDNLTNEEFNKIKEWLENE